LAAIENEGSNISASLIALIIACKFGDGCGGIAMGENSDPDLTVEDDLILMAADALYVDGVWTKIMFSKMGSFLSYSDYYDASDSMARFLIYTLRDEIFQ
jgi:hypothetical protein